MSTSYVPTGFKTAQKSRSRPSKSFFVRKYEEEDDNQYLAHRVKRKNRKEKIRHILDSIKCFKLPSSSPMTCLAVPKKRNFDWAIETWHAPTAFHPQDLRSYSPWFICLRFLALDLEAELRDGGIESWRKLPVSLPEDFAKYDKTFCQDLNKYGRRIIFSEISENSRHLVGRWLVVAYIWCDTKEQLRNFDWMGQVSIDTVYSYQAREKLDADPSLSLWHKFHVVTRSSKGLGPENLGNRQYESDRTERMCQIVDQQVQSFLKVGDKTHVPPKKKWRRKNIRYEVIHTVDQLRKLQGVFRTAEVASLSTLL